MKASPMLRRPPRRRLIRSKSILTFLPFLILGAGLFWWWDWTPIDRAFGRFDGQVVSLWDYDGLNMRLERDFAYIDPDGRRWIALAVEDMETEVAKWDAAKKSP